MPEAPKKALDWVNCVLTKAMPTLLVALVIGIITTWLAVRDGMQEIHGRLNVIDHRLNAADLERSRFFRRLYEDRR